MREAAEATVAVSSDSEVIFEGRVERQEPTSIDILKLANDPHAEDKAHRTVFFAVTRVYRGAEREIFKVETGWGGGDCGFDFVTGKEYLVYAGQGDHGNLRTGICSPTILLEHAGPEVRVLRGEPADPEDLLSRDAYYKQIASKWMGSVCGKVFDAVGKPLKEASPIRDGPFGEGDEITSDANGSFCFRQVDPGKFLLNANVPDKKGTKLKGFYPGVSNRSEASVLEVKATEKVNGLNFRLHEESVHTLQFRIVNAINHPLPSDLQVMLLDSLNPATMDYHEIETIAADGTATFESVPEGHYFATVFLDRDDDSTEAKRFIWKPIKEEIDVNGEMQEIVLTLIPLD